MKPKLVAILLAFFAVFAVVEVHSAPAPKKEKEPAAKPSVPQQATYHLTGIFDGECEINLRTALAEIPGVALVKFDVRTADATITYDPVAAFPGYKPDKIPERFDQFLRQASGYMISAKPATATEKDKLKQIELPVVILHCRACCLALHEMLMKQDGVEQVLIDFKNHKVQATIDPETTSKEKLIAYMKSREITTRQ